MRIKKVFNNNVLMTMDDRGQEQIVSGKGIGYGRKAGESIDPTQVTQLFILSDEERRNFEALLSEIPVTYLEVTSEIVKMIRADFGSPLNASLDLQLCDHIYTSVKRCRAGKTVPNALLLDIKRYYFKEFKLGLAALAIINEHFDVDMPEDEAGFIALHIVNAQVADDDSDTTYQVMTVMQEVTRLVKYHFGFDFDEDDVHYYRFINHLRYLAQRIILHHRDAMPQDDGLLEVLKQRYSLSYACIERINQLVTTKYQYPLSEAEQLYLLIHVERLYYTHVQHSESDQ